MQKIGNTLKPPMIVELIKFPISRSICKKNLTKPNLPRFKHTAINSAIAYLNKVDLASTRPTPAKFKKGLSKVEIGEKASEEILKDLNKSVEKKVKQIISKQDQRPIAGLKHKLNYILLLLFFLKSGF